MTNVTKSLGIVQDVDAITTLAPPLGTQLVVFRRGRRGEEPLGVLPPGEAFQPGFLERRSSLRLLAVSTDPNLRHEFSQSFQHRDQVHTFILRFRMEYRVEAPEKLIETLPRDPLACIEKEVIERIGRSVQSMEWSDMVQHREQVGQRALLLSPPNADGHRLENLTRLRQFCLDHGIELLDLDVTCRLDEAAIEVDRMRDEKQREQEKLLVSEATETVRISSDRRLDLEKGQARLEAAQAENNIAAVIRSRELADKVLAHLDTALGRVAGSVDSAPGLRSAVVELARLQKELREVTALPSPQMHQLDGERQPLLLASSDGFARHAELLSTLLDQIAGLDCPADDRRRVLGKVLRLMGETLQGESADEEAITSGVHDLEATVDGLVRALRTPEQRRFFQELCQRDWWERWT